MGAYAGPYIPGVYVAVGGGGGGLVAAPRLHSGLQCSSVGKLVIIPCMKGFSTTTDEGDGVGWTTIGVAGMRGDSGDARDEENGGEGGKPILAYTSTGSG